MTIPQHLIERAAEAWTGMPLTDMHPEDATFARETAQLTIAAVASDIWWNGYEVAEQDMDHRPPSNGKWVHPIIDTTRNEHT